MLDPGNVEKVKQVPSFLDRGIRLKENVNLVQICGHRVVPSLRKRD